MPVPASAAPSADAPRPLATRRAQLCRYLRGNWGRSLVGGAGTTASYGIALWAMTMAPVAVIAALRAELATV